MTSDAFYNEPGYELMKGKGMPGIDIKAKAYNKKIQYETLRVAVLGMINGSLDSRSLPKDLKEKIQQRYQLHYDIYMKVIQDNITSTEYDYKSLEIEFNKIKPVTVAAETMPVDDSDSDCELVD